MCYVKPTEEIERKQRIVSQYKKNALEFIPGTPDYVLEMNEEIKEFYRKECEGTL